jgi:hypothetical protein
LKPATWRPRIAGEELAADCEDLAGAGGSRVKLGSLRREETLCSLKGADMKKTLVSVLVLVFGLGLVALSAPLSAAASTAAAPPAITATAAQGIAAAVAPLPAWDPAILPATPAPASAQSLDTLLAPPGVITCPPRCNSLNCNLNGGCACLQVGFCLRCEC